MQRKKAEQFEWLEFEILADIKKLRHGVFLRKGGYSLGAFKGLNVSYDVGDNPSHVESNRKLLTDHFRSKKILDANQRHGNNVHFYPNNLKNCLGIAGNSQGSDTPACDALCTEAAQFPLVIKHADCQAAIFYDPVRHVLANVHSGWRGSVQNIYDKTIQTLKARCGSRPSDLLAAISPSLGPDSAEFIHYKEELPKSFHSFQAKPLFFDFWQITRCQLEECGLLPHHIEIACIDTYSHPEDYFSYRRDKICGRNATAAMLL